LQTVRSRGGEGAPVQWEEWGGRTGGGRIEGKYGSLRGVLSGRRVQPGSEAERGCRLGAGGVNGRRAGGPGGGLHAAGATSGYRPAPAPTRGDQHGRDGRGRVADIDARAQLTGPQRQAPRRGCTVYLASALNVDASEVERQGWRPRAVQCDGGAAGTVLAVRRQRDGRRDRAGRPGCSGRCRRLFAHTLEHLNPRPAFRTRSGGRRCSFAGHHSASRRAPPRDSGAVDCGGRAASRGGGRKKRRSPAS